MDFTGSLPSRIMPAVHELIHRRSAGKLTRQEFVEQLTKLTGRSEKEVAQATLPGGHKNLRLLDYIGQLKNKGYKIGLLSNVGSNWVRQKFLTTKEQHLFNDILLSYEVGLTKPDPESFKLACKRLETDISQCILVDDIERYCEAARETGLQAVWYQNFEQMKRELEDLLAKG